MKTYEVMVNGKQQGTIQTADIHGYIKQNYAGVSHKLEGNKLHLSMTLGQAMSIGLNKASNIKVCLHKKGAHMLERKDGQWILDGKVIDQETAINELVEAVQDLGYWCQVAKDVLPTEEFAEVQRCVEYRE